MSFSRKIFVAVTSACVVCVFVCVCVWLGGVKQKVNFCDSSEYELSNMTRTLLH